LYGLLLSPGPFIGPVEIRGEKNKKNIRISFLPPVYCRGYWADKGSRGYGAYKKGKKPSK